MILHLLLEHGQRSIPLLHLQKWREELQRRREEEEYQRQEEEFVGLLYLWHLRRQQRRRRRVSVRPWIQRRQLFGQYEILMAELE